MAKEAKKEKAEGVIYDRALVMAEKGFSDEEILDDLLSLGADEELAVALTDRALDEVEREDLESGVYRNAPELRASGRSARTSSQADACPS